VKTSSDTFALGIIAFFLCALPIHADTFYVSNQQGNTIVKFNSNGTRSTFASVGLNSPAGLAFDSIGNLFVANEGNGTIEKFDLSGHGTVFASGLIVPWGIAVDKNNNVYASTADNKILRFDSGGRRSTFADATSGLINPAGMTFDSNGNLFVVNWSGDNVLKFDLSGNGTLFASAGLDGPVGLAFDAGGNLYVSSNGPGTIHKFDPSGNGSLFVNSGLNGPDGLAFDSGGNLYVANYGGDNVRKIDSSGQGAVFASNIRPVFIAVIPEPTSWAIMACGFGGFLSYRRHQGLV
jgi:DNA-binding beta-propeller fold protein YncE